MQFARADERAMRRFIGMFSESYFGVPKGFFGDKKVLDAGCGNTAKLLIAMYRMGCRQLVGCDIGDEFIPASRETLRAYDVPPEGVTFKSCSVLKLDFPDETFDVTCAHGVLLHLNTMEEVRAAFRELARVTKRGGLLYSTYANAGGFLEDCIFPAVREYYRSNKKFRNLVDNVKPQHFAHLIGLIEKGLREHENANVDLGLLKDAYDTDFCVTIQNIVQVPVQLPIDEPFVRSCYAESGFEEPRRMKRYVKRENIRRYFAPLHHEWDDELVSIIYGSGSLEFIGRKP